MMLHIARISDVPPADAAQDLPASTAPITSSHAATGIKSDLLLLTCRVLVEAPDGSTVEARALLQEGVMRLMTNPTSVE